MENKQYEDVNGITIQTGISYRKGGVNWYNGQPERAGYYLHVTPVIKSEHFIESQLGDGFKYLVLQVDRQSKKRLQTAIQIAETHKERLTAIAVNQKLDKVA